MDWPSLEPAIDLNGLAALHFVVNLIRTDTNYSATGNWAQCYSDPLLPSILKALLQTFLEK